jgi:uncharacterized protein YjiS (DUF1127 family)
MTQHILIVHNYSTRAVELILETLKSIYNNRIERKAIRETEKALNALSNKDLADIGLCRGDIYDVARYKSSIAHVKANKNLQGWV